MHRPCSGGIAAIEMVAVILRVARSGYRLLASRGNRPTATVDIGRDAIQNRGDVNACTVNFFESLQLNFVCVDGIRKIQRFGALIAGAPRFIYGLAFRSKFGDLVISAQRDRGIIQNDKPLPRSVARNVQCSNVHRFGGIIGIGRRTVHDFTGKAVRKLLCLPRKAVKIGVVVGGILDLASRNRGRCAAVEALCPHGCLIRCPAFTKERGQYPDTARREIICYRRILVGIGCTGSPRPFAAIGTQGGLPAEIVHPAHAGVNTLRDLQTCVSCNTCVRRAEGRLCLLCKTILQDARERRRIVERDMERFCQALFRVCIGQRNAEILGSFDIDARHRCRAFGKIIMELPLAFFFGGGTQVATGEAVSQQFYIVGQCDVRTAAVGRIQHLHTDGDDGVVLTVHAGKRGCGAVGIEQSLIKCDLNRAVGIVVTVILIAPTLDADFCLTGQHRQTVGVEVVPGSRLRQAGIHPRLDFFHGQPAVRCRRLFYLVGGFCGCGFCRFRRGNLIGRGGGNHRAAHSTRHKRRR